jgi:hypothetical protein
MPSINPYDPPEVGSQPSNAALQERVVAGPWVLSIEWTVVLAFNLIVPALVAWPMTTTNAKIGCLFAIVIVGLTGYYLCISHPLPILFAIRGGLVVALSQVIPVVHFTAGAMAIRSLIVVGVIRESSFYDMLSTVTAGFLVTLITACVLIGASFVVGLLLRMVTPDRWWLARSHRLGTN